MQILKIKLSKDEQDAIFNELTKRFNTEDKRQTIESDERLITYESTLELYTEYPDPDENNQTAISNRGVIFFQITFFHDGEEVEVDDWDIDDRIKKYYEV